MRHLTLVKGTRSSLEKVNLFDNSGPGGLQVRRIREKEQRERLQKVARELSEMLGVPVATLYSWRYHGRGPAAVRVGRHLRYRLSDVDAWLAYSEREHGRRP